MWGDFRRELSIYRRWHDALAPRVPGLFDDDLEALRTQVKRWRQAKNRRSR
jgi:hypothetical protein